MSSAMIRMMFDRFVISDGSLSPVHAVSAEMPITGNIDVNIFNVFIC